MIRIHIFDLPGGGQRRMYENLVSVGAPKESNTNADKASNQLVQFFLRKFFEKNPGKMPKSKFSKFLLDGKVGTQTTQGIGIFQTHARNAGTPLFVDSRVSVPLGINVPGTGMRWTIHALNSFFFLRFGEAAFNNLFANSEISKEAPELSAELVAEEQLLA